MVGDGAANLGGYYAHQSLCLYPPCLAASAVGTRCTDSVWCSRTMESDACSSPLAV